MESKGRILTLVCELWELLHAAAISRASSFTSTSIFPKQC